MNIALLGYGKMGKEIEKIALERNHNIVLKIDENNLNEHTKENLSKADVAIEFSTPDSVIENIYRCFDAEIPVVIGTTGWYKNLEEIKSVCKNKNQAMLFASNFSVGVNLFFELNKQLSKLMNSYSNYEITMEEIHHIHKKDAPSGTAITLANDIVQNIERKNNWVNNPSEDTKDLVIKSVREDSVPGTHSIKYSSVVDDIEIKHTAHNRTGFALGAVLAAEFIKDKKGIFGMNDVLKIEK